MSLPRALLTAIAAVVPDEAGMEAVARDWQRRIPEMQATAERIRAQVRAGQDTQTQDDGDSQPAPYRSLPDLARAAGVAREFRDRPISSHCTFLECTELRTEAAANAIAGTNTKGTTA
jgi:hypothetical protein